MYDEQYTYAVALNPCEGDNPVFSGHDRSAYGM